MEDNPQVNNSIDYRDFIKKDLDESTDMTQDLEGMQNKAEESDKDQSSEERVNSSNPLSTGNMQDIQNSSVNNPCDECGKSFSDKASLSSHKSYIHKIEVSVCQVCGNEFQNKIKLQQHVNSVHIDQSIQCEMCSKLFKNRSLLYLHKKVVHEVTENLTCPSCGIKVMNTYKLQFHLKRSCVGYKRTKAAPTSTTCVECNKTFKTNKILNDHYKFSHSYDTFTCQICQKNFKNIPSFRNHLKRSHTTIGPNRVLALINEIRPESEKKESKNLACQICLNKFKNINSFRNHLKRFHKTIGPNRILALINEVRLEMEKKECKNLTAYQKQRRDLVQKWKEIEKEQNALKMTFKSIEKHQCDECGKSFSDKEKLNNHTRIKHTFDPCTCPFCGSILDNKSNLRQHIKQFHKDISTAKKGAKKIEKEIKMNIDLSEEFPMATVKTENDSINVKMEINHSTEMKQPIDGMCNKHKIEESEKEQSFEDVKLKTEAHEPVDEPHTCPFCEGTILKNKTYLMMHINRFHEGSKLPDYYKTKYEYINLNTDHVFSDAGRNEFNEDIDAENILEKSEDKIVINENYVIDEKIKTFICDSCGKAFEKASLLKRHERVHSDEKPFGCSDCPKTFTSKAGVDYHKLSHTKEIPFMCDFCPKTFTTKFRLKQHKRSHTGEKPYSCAECGKSFSTKDILKMHKKKGNCYENKPLICNLCSKTFKYGANLKSHEQICNGGKRVSFFICSECGKTFKSKIVFQDHKCDEPKIKEQNGDKRVKSFICPECGKTCKSKIAFQNHKCDEPKIEEPQKCSICQQEFRNAVVLRKHQKRTIKCSQIGTESYVQCYDCGKTCKSKFALQRHIYYVHPTKEQQHMICSLCGKEFKNYISLKQHQRKTIGCSQAGNANPVKCPVCGKEFANKHALYGHNFIENVNCPNCGKTCKNKHLLRLHITRTCVSAVNTAKDEISNK